MKDFNNEIFAENLKQFREYKSFTVTKLAKELDITKQTLSGYEMGKFKPSEKVFCKLIEISGLSSNFFLKKTSSSKINSYLSFRKLKSSSELSIKSSMQIACIFSEIINFLSNKINFPKNNLPNYNIDFNNLSNEKIEEIAIQLREYWNINQKPINNISLLLEINGVFITQVKMDNKIDAFSYWNEDKPIIILSKEKLQNKAVRLNFDLAHELGHLILHKNVSKEEFSNNFELNKLLEKQANYFAGAFLLPKKTFLEDIFSFSIHNLKLIKKKWLVSIQAMIMRLSALNKISDNQKIYLITQLGDRKTEIFDDELIPSKQVLLNNAFEILLNSGISKEEIFETLNLNENIIIEISNLDSKLFMDKEKTLCQVTLKTLSKSELSIN